MRILIILITSCLLSSCATIVGGKMYYAHVKIEDHPNAEIRYNGIKQGNGEATFKVERKLANQFEIEIHEDGCEVETFSFHRRVMRGWALTGTIVFWTGFYYIPLPWGVIVDGSTGAWWKPDMNEQYVSKINYDNFLYLPEYKGCGGKSYRQQETYYWETGEEGTQNSDNEKSKADRLREIKDLFDEGILTEEEFKREKEKILKEEE